MVRQCEKCGCLWGGLVSSTPAPVDCPFCTQPECYMHYRNGREAKNGDKIVRLSGGKVDAFGVLTDAKPGNDYCNGDIVHEGGYKTYACLCDCLHVDDLAAVLAEKGLDKRPNGT